MDKDFILDQIREAKESLAYHKQKVEFYEKMLEVLQRENSKQS